jgi:glycerophosphoryl diester phosphodiesterase
MPTPIIVAHRGIHDTHPENSLEALLAAWNAGVTWCECDIRGSSDDVPFLLHDGTLDRTSEGLGTIEQTISDVVARLKLRREDKSVSGCLIPTLEQVIPAMPPGTKFLIEIKPKVSDAVSRRTMQLCDPETCIVQSFDAPILHRAAEIRPEIELMLLVDKATDPLAAEKGPWTQVNANFKSLDAATVRMIRDRGFRVGAWTPNDEPDINHMLQLNLDMIISDHPLRAMRLAGLSKIG